MINYIKKIYFSVWADAINYERIKNGGEGHWKIFTYSYMTIFMVLNILSLLSAILFFTGFDMFSSLMLKIDKIFLNEKLSNLVWSILVLFIPSMLITYFLVFYKKKYEYILNNYSFKNGRFLFIYFMITIICFFGFSFLNKFF